MNESSNAIATPLVSIGVPIYNSVSKFDKNDVFLTALNALRNQDYPNIEIIIVDNASLDDTWLFCQEMAQQDDRIKIYRNDKNIGIHNNLSRTFELATGQYYMIASDDDDWEPNFVSHCVAQLEANSQFDLCFPLFTEVNLQNGTQYPRSHLIQDSFQSGWRRALHLMTFKIRPQTMILGVFRREKIRDLFPIHAIMNGDLLFLYEFAFRSQFKSIQVTLGKKYVRPKQSKSRYSAQNITVPTPTKIVAVFKMIALFYKATWEADTSLFGKILCSLAILRFFIAGVIYVLTLHKVRL